MRANNNSSMKIMCVCACDFFVKGTTKRHHCDRNFHRFFSFRVSFLFTRHIYTITPHIKSEHVQQQWKMEAIRKIISNIILWSTQTVHTAHSHVSHIYKFICINVCIFVDLKCARTHKNRDRENFPFTIRFMVEMKWKLNEQSKQNIEFNLNQTTPNPQPKSNPIPFNQIKFKV